MQFMETILEKIYHSLDEEQKEIANNTDLSKTVEEIVLYLEEKSIVSFSSRIKNDKENQSN